MHTYNHGDVLLLLLQEVLQEPCCAAQGQVLKRVRGPMPQLQHVQPVPQPGQMDHLSAAESAEGLVDQICAGRGAGQWRKAISSASASLSISLHF